MIMGTAITYCKLCGSKIAFIGGAAMCGGCSGGEREAIPDAIQYPSSDRVEREPDGRPILLTAALAFLGPVVILLLALGLAR
jgi:hypothetical protein